MIATVVNALAVMVGSFIGLLAKHRIKEKYSKTIMAGLAVCVAVIGVDSAIETSNILIVIISVVVGSIIGELLKIESRIEGIGRRLKKRFDSGGENSRFTEGFVSASLLFCIGSMAIMGSLEAGINQNYSVIFSKSVIDGVTAVTLASTMGIGVMFSAAAVLVYQGLITLLASWVGPFLSALVVTEMSAVGGIILVCIAVNMLSLREESIRAGNMLPAIFLPIGLVPLFNWAATLL